MGSSGCGRTPEPSLQPSRVGVELAFHFHFLDSCLSFPDFSQTLRTRRHYYCPLKSHAFQALELLGAQMVQRDIAPGMVTVPASSALGGFHWGLQQCPPWLLGWLYSGLGPDLILGCRRWF